MNAPPGKDNAPGGSQARVRDREDSQAENLANRGTETQATQAVGVVLCDLCGLSPVLIHRILFGRSVGFCGSCAALEEIDVGFLFTAWRARARAVLAEFDSGARRIDLQPSDYIRALIETVPCLQGKLESIPDPFDGEVFERRSRPWSHGERLAALFVLNVWNPGVARSLKWRFDLFEAVGVLSRENLEPMLAWVRKPRWP